jgi:hypothetical protein
VTAEHPGTSARHETLPPRVVLVHRRTEFTELVDRHGTRGQAAFFLEGRGGRLAEVEARHHLVTSALAAVTAAVPGEWRRGRVERAELPRFSFDPGDIVVVVGQDGLVANVAKYLDGQPVIGINPEPGRNPGVLVRHSAADASALLAACASVQGPPADALSMAQADTDDGQRLLALNEIFFGHPSHQTARYSLAPPGRMAEPQASSGVIIGTGTGATGWCRSLWLEKHSTLTLPAPSEQRLTWFVREAWPSSLTGTECTEGQLGSGQSLTVSVASDRLVLFGDGVESDAIGLSSGQIVTIGLASRTLSLVR